MGVWGPGNFDNDVADDFLDALILELHKNIDECLLPETRLRFSLDEHGDGKLMPGLDILITLCEHYEISPMLEISKVNYWKNSYLEIYDEIIDKYGAKEDYKAQRRNVIKNSFNKLLELVELYPW